ncbi:MAG: carboxypeptidase-like regulatory domain-containing protein [Fibrobacter sp.]|jgi:hypothetical protein|nr:carboxypeptidase-like regulatory domain-containing protein [Fibrobacter sp.]
MRSFLLILLSVFLISCGINDTESGEYSKWTLSGNVVDGFTNQPLKNAKIVYLDENGKEAVVKTDASGAFFIQSLPYGSRVFTFSHTHAGKQDTLSYGTRIFTFTSVSESASMEGVVASAARVIRLYPLNAALSGEIFFADSETKIQTPAKKVRVNLSYKDTNFVNDKTARFTAVTDSTGRFLLNELPADTGFTLSFEPVLHKEQRYTAPSLNAGKLTSKVTADLGRVLMAADTSVKAQSFILSSNVLDKNGLGLREMSPLTVPYFVMKEALSANNLKVTLMYDSLSVFISPVVKKDTLFLTHYSPLPESRTFNVEIYGYTKKNERVHVKLNGNASFETGRGLYAVSSNASPVYENYRSSFSVLDTLWVSFSEDLAPNIDRIQWNKAASADLTLYGNGSSKNADVWVKEDTLFIMPLALIETDSLADPGDKLGFNIMVYAASGLSLSGFTLYTELGQ